MLLLLLGACGDGAPEGPDEQPEAVEVPDPDDSSGAASTGGDPPEDPDEQAEEIEATNPDDSSGPVDDLDEVRGATVQIIAEGTFVDPEMGQQDNHAGSGSGFIVHPSGIAVTNNHVVTGGALLRVLVGGEEPARNARVLGYSECSDLAVIEIDGDGYPYLDWFRGDVTPGLDVFAAGYPLWNPEFTLTRGIVSKGRTSGQTFWASVDGVIEHDAAINPGNSGGPLVTSTGQVVGVNYAYYPRPGANQYLAIGGGQAERIIEQLRAGENIHSIGINGQAVVDGDLSGIWVASVASGSPADQTGIQPGDIITRMEGLRLATDGTMADFCDVLRSREASDTMSVEVLRFATEEMLNGELNGRELEQSFSFAQKLQDEDVGRGGSTASSYSGYQTVTDDSGTIRVEVPKEWIDVDDRSFLLEGNLIYDLVVAPDLQGFYDTWTTPGAWISASTDLARTEDETSLLNALADGFDTVCNAEGRFPYEDPLYTGFYEYFTDCGGEGVDYVIVGAVNASRTVVIGVQVQVVDDRDLDALDRILATFVAD